ncbi:MAG: sulfatase-like hydrolase/transferase, partial [Pseudomonadales bacterium]
MSDPATDQVHLEAKQSYLASLPAADPNAPNIVIIFFDDLGWGDLSSYGNALIQTPQIDAIAADGLRMTSFYSASPVCTPSRA